MKTKKLTAIIVGVVLALTACSGVSTGQSGTTSSTGEFFTTDTIHTISVDFSDDDYQTMLDTYSESGDKTWIEASVTIDGTTFEQVGIKLKGNSSLRGLDTSTSSSQSGTAENTGDGISDADNPQTLPWVIALDKYVDGQSYSGRTRFVIRSNETESSLNEAVALAMLNEAGVPAEQAAFTRFSVNDSEQKLRLVVDVPDDDLWNEETFGTSGYIYKANADGDYSYRGDDAESYTDVFSQKYGEDNLEPLTQFLDFINNSSDEEFESNLDTYLDTDAFATYRAVQKLIANEDDIDGMGNNSYLHYDPETGQMTVVAWDHNLAFNGMANMGGGNDFGGGQGPGGTPDDGQSFDGEMPSDLPDTTSGNTRPTDMPDSSGDNQGGPGNRQMPDMSEMQSGDMPEGMEAPDGNFGGGKGGMSGNNILVSRFEASETFNALYEKKLSSLTESLIDSGFAQGVLDSYVTLLTEQASDLVSAETVQSDASQIESVFTEDEQEQSS